MSICFGLLQTKSNYAKITMARSVDATLFKNPENIDIRSISAVKQCIANNIYKDQYDFAEKPKWVIDEDDLDAVLKWLLSGVIPPKYIPTEFSPTNVYYYGNRVWYQDTLYTCIAKNYTAGAFDSSCFEAETSRKLLSIYGSTR